MLRIQDIDHLVLRVQDVDRMVRFYRDVLGCPVHRIDDGLDSWLAGQISFDECHAREFRRLRASRGQHARAELFKQRDR